MRPDKHDDTQRARNYLLFNIWATDDEIAQISPWVAIPCEVGVIIILGWVIGIGLGWW